MTTPTRCKLMVLAPLCVIAALAHREAHAAGQLSDAAGDAVIRRTDDSNNGEIGATTVLPDLTSVSIRGWTMTTPGGDPYIGAQVNGVANMMRIDAEFVGMLNPPGPLEMKDFDPCRFGPSPLYGFIEIDVDADPDTGGQTAGAARVHLLGNAARFGTRPTGVLSDRTPETSDRDNNYLTLPFYERSGEDFALAFCGCFAPEIVSGDNGNGLFEAGEVWKLRGRFFPRAGGYADASSFFDGSGIGQYDPQVILRWAYSASTNRTTVSLVYPLTPAGAAMLFNTAVQPVDGRFGDQAPGGNHFSLQEGVQDLITIAQGGAPGLSGVLIARWASKSATGFLVPANYGVHALVGTAYSSYESSRYVWTDVAFGMPRGDVNGDGVANNDDAAEITSYLAATDGTPNDSDGVVNGSVPVVDYGTNFFIYDVTGDGFVDAADVSFYPTYCPADWDRNGVVNSTDVSLFLNDWFDDLLHGGTTTDRDNNGVVNSTDVSVYINTWFSDVVGCTN